MAENFETKVLVALARIEEKVDSSDKKHSEHFEYRNKVLAPRMAVVDALKERMDKHSEGHERWRVGAGIAIIGAYLKGFLHG